RPCTDTRAVPRPSRGGHRRTGVRDPTARGAPPALGSSPRTRRRARLLGGAQGTAVGPGGEPTRGADGGSPARVRLLRGGDTRGRIRRWAGADLGFGNRSD